MKKKYGIYWLLVVTAFFMLHSYAVARDKVVYIPIVGVVGNELPSNVKSYTNSIGMTFNLIPAGTFIMGSPDTEPGRWDDETQHQVTLTKSFYMQTTEVTNGQWDAVIVDKGRGQSPSGASYKDDEPVDTISWYEAASFANWLSHDEGLTPCYNGNGTCTGTLGDDFTCTSVTINTSCTGYHLPTEAQWEYAVRATTTTAWSYFYNYDTTATGEETGDGFNSNLHTMGWYEFNNEGGDLSRDVPGYLAGAKPVAKKQANKWGLFDMHGNLVEWCQDWYADYPAGPVTDPTGPDSPGSVHTHRVIRGGLWTSSAGRTRSAARSASWQDLFITGVGFRLALPPGQ